MARPLNTKLKTMDPREYLDRIIKRYLNIKGLHRQLTEILEWQQPNRVTALKVSPYFFRLTIYSMSRIILVELTSLLQAREDRSLISWLKNARSNFQNVDPAQLTVYESYSECIRMTSQDYCKLIDTQLEQIRAESITIERIRARRNKSIAHLEAAYFDDPGRLNKDFPLTDDDIDRLFQVLDDVLRKQHNAVFASDLLMDVHSTGHVDRLLTAARAWHRVRKDNDLIIKSGFRPVDYTRDEYPPNRD